MPHGAPASDARERTVLRFLKALAGVGIVQALALSYLWLAPMLQPKRYSNHNDQVADVLRAKGIVVGKVFLDQGWPDRINSSIYSADLAIYQSDAADAKPVFGRIECRVEKRSCWFHVAKLGVPRQELTDLMPATAATVPELGWRERALKVLDTLGLRL